MCHRNLTEYVDKRIMVDYCLVKVLKSNALNADRELGQYSRMLTLRLTGNFLDEYYVPM